MLIIVMLLFACSMWAQSSSGSLDGTADHMEVASALCGGTLPISMVATFRPTSGTGDEYIATIGDASANHELSMVERSQTAWRCVQQGASFSSATITSALTDDQWIKVGCVFASSTSRTAYAEGSTSVESTVSRTSANLDVTAVGVRKRFSGEDLFFGGQIREVCMWCAALTSEEVEQAYFEGTPCKRIRPASLEAVYSLGPAFGPDYSGNANDMTNNGITGSAEMDGGVSSAP